MQLTSMQASLAHTSGHSWTWRPTPKSRECIQTASARLYLYHRRHNAVDDNSGLRANCLRAPDSAASSPQACKLALPKPVAIPGFGGRRSNHWNAFKRRLRTCIIVDTMLRTIILTSVPIVREHLVPQHAPHKHASLPRSHEWLLVDFAAGAQTAGMPSNGVCALVSSQTQCCGRTFRHPCQFS